MIATEWTVETKEERRHLFNGSRARAQFSDVTNLCKEKLKVVLCKSFKNEWSFFVNKLKASPNKKLVSMIGQ